MQSYRHTINSRFTKSVQHLQQTYKKIGSTLYSPSSSSSPWNPYGLWNL